MHRTPPPIIPIRRIASIACDMECAILLARADRRYGSSSANRIRSKETRGRWDRRDNESQSEMMMPQGYRDPKPEPTSSTLFERMDLVVKVFVPWVHMLSRSYLG